MEVDAATVGVKKWGGEEMIYINQHRGEHEEPRFFPFLSEKDIGNQSWNQKMKGIMDYGLEHLRFLAKIGIWE
jgi:ATP-dependent RNA circularization protein (DNA/RNA ligase family)